MPWIFNSSKNDSLWLILPGLLSIIFVFSINFEDHTALAFIFFFIAKGLLDSGHIAITYFRTYADPEENKKPIYIWLPLCLFFSFFAWMYFSLPGFWAFVIYTTVFHNFRQYYGITRWYQKLNQRFDKKSDIFLHLLCLIPFIAFHFRDLNNLDLYFDPSVIPFTENSTVFKILTILWILIFLLFLTREARLYKLKKESELNRIFSVFVPAFIYFISFIFGKNLEQIFLPNVLAHGIAYIGMTSLALHRTQTQNFKYFLKITFLMALIWGSIVTLSEVFFLDDYTYDFFITKNLWIIGFISLYLTPLFMHYFYDAFLWKSSHPKAKYIYKPDAPKSP